MTPLTDRSCGNDISEIKIVEQEQDNYVTLEFTIDGKKSNVEISIRHLLDTLYDNGWWFKGGTHSNEPQAWRTFNKTYPLYREFLNQMPKDINEAVCQLAHLVLDKHGMYRRYCNPYDINNAEEYPHTNDEIIKRLKIIERKEESK